MADSTSNTPIYFTKERVQVLISAARAVDDELKSLNEINKRKAVMEISELYEISSTLLYFYMEYGEVEGERLMLARNK